MKPPLRSHTLATSVVWCVLVFSNEVSSTYFRYTEDHNVWTLNSNTMAVLLGAEQYGKLLLFDNFFSEECLQFAPTYRSLGVDLHPWRSLLHVMVLDCADRINLQICRDYNVSEVPTLRYFPPGYRRSPRYLGDEITVSRDPESIKRSLLSSIAKSRYTVRIAAIFAPLSLYDNVPTIVEARQLYDGRPLKFIVLVFQPMGSLIGVETILELSSIPYLIVRIAKNTWIFDNFGLNSTDLGLAVVDRGGNSQGLTPANTTGRAYGNAVRQYLQYFNQELERTRLTTEAASVEEYQAFRDKLILLEPRRDHKQVFRADLEVGIQRFINVELGNRPALIAESLNVLVQFLDVLHSMNPLNEYAQEMFIKLRQGLKYGKGNITEKLIANTTVEYGSNITEKLLAGGAAILESPRDKVFRAKLYIGCASSRASLRGYPCSLWILFHYWTVGNAKSYPFPPGTILKVVRGFVNHLFTCPGCTEVYEDLVDRLGMDQVTTHDQEILWLWSAHNEINRQLRGKASEDPMFPKIQFPSPKSCPKCRDETGEWQKDQVLKYLKDLYDSDNFSLYGLPSYVGYT